MSDAIPMLDLQAETRALREELLVAINRVLDSARFIMGPEVSDFEAEFARYLGVERALGVNSGTDALIIGMQALGAAPGDEIITTPFTFVATGSSILHAGATPVFADIDPATYNIDVKSIEANITDATKGIVVVHLFGRPAPMDEILELAAAHSLWVFEDVAQAVSGTYRKKFLGTIGDAGAFSFFPSKNLGAYGDGGALVINDPEHRRHANTLRVHGAQSKYHNEILGFNSRLDAMQAAILRVKLAHLPEATRLRREAAARYDDLLSGVPSAQAPANDTREDHSYHQYTLRLPPEKRDAVRSSMGDAKVSTMIYYPIILPDMPLFAGCSAEVPHARAAAASVLSLPIWPGIAPETQARVIDTLKMALESA